MDQVAGPEDLLRGAAGAAEGFRAADVTAEEQGFLGGAGARRLGDAVTAPEDEERMRAGEAVFRDQARRHNRRTLM